MGRTIELRDFQKVLKAAEISDDLDGFKDLKIGTGKLIELRELYRIRLQRCLDLNQKLEGLEELVQALNSYEKETINIVLAKRHNMLYTFFTSTDFDFVLGVLKGGKRER